MWPGLPRAPTRRSCAPPCNATPMRHEANRLPKAWSRPASWRQTPARSATSTPPLRARPARAACARRRAAPVRWFADRHEHSAALCEGHQIALWRAVVELARPADLVLGVADHFIELGDPADRAREREDRREQAHRNADRALHDARIEVDVRVQLAGHEVLVFERDLLELH